VAIFAGGTGLYFKTLTRGLFGGDGTGRDEAVRRELEAEWDADGGKRLWKELEARDAATAAKLHPNDKLRVVRAHEVLRLTGEAPSELQRRAREAFSPPPAVRVVLRMGRDVLYERIDRRVLQMMDQGFLEEVERLVENGANADWPGMRALGYPQMQEVIRGKADLDEAIAETQKLSRHYAKRQFVLYRRWEESAWLDASDDIDRNASLIELMLELYGK
jgi:tRNA dimethylallyltransferase